MLLGVGGLAIGLLVDPGPGADAPGVHGFATVADVPPGRLDPAVLDRAPTPAVVVLPAVVAGVVLLVEPMVEVVLPALPLLEGVHGATVDVVPDGVRCVCCPRVPPVTLPGLPATPGVPGLTAGVPVEAAPDGLVVVGVPGLLVVVPGWVVVTPG